MKSYVFVSKLLFAVLFVSGCTISQADLAATSTSAASSPLIVGLKENVLLNPACLPPCFEGVTPGVTLAEGAVQILADNHLFSVEVYESEFGGSSYINFELPGRFDLNRADGGSAIFDSNANPQIVRAISLTTSGLTLGEIIDVFGEPTHIIPGFSEPMDVDGVSFWRPVLIWSTIGFAGEYGYGYPDKPTLDDTLVLTHFDYYPIGIDNYLNSGVALVDPDLILKWHGYDDLDNYLQEAPTP